MTTHPPSGVPVRDLVALATRAPSVHNTQPWRWCIDGERVSLFADGSRQLQYADPDGRDLVISCGATLQHLQVAAAAAGWKARVRRMPNPHNDNQLANVSFQPEQPTSEALTALDALIKRRTDRRRPSSWPVPRERLDGLLALGPAAGVTVLGVISHTRRVELLRLLAEAERAQRLNQQYVDEILSWAGRQGDEGIPTTSLLRPSPGPAPTWCRPLPLRNPDRQRPGGGARRTRPACDRHVLRRHGLATAGRGSARGDTSEGHRRRLRDGAPEPGDRGGSHPSAAPGRAPQGLSLPTDRHPGRLGAGRCRADPTHPEAPVEDVLGDVSSLPLWIGPYHA